MSAEQFVMMTPVYAALAEDEAALADLEEHARTVDWEEAVTSSGGRVLGEPVVTREPNPNYGRTLPVCTEDGEPLIDHVKLYLFARGWAER